MSKINPLKNYWDDRGQASYTYKGETFYTITPIPFYYQRRSLLLGLMDTLLSKPSVETICDFGCGDGYYLQYFGNLYPEKKFYGIDISRSMIECAERKAPFAHLRIMHDKINFDNTFGLIYSIAVFSHIQDDRVSFIFSNLFQKIAPGGNLVIFEQTGPTRKEGNTWCRRTTREYIELAYGAGFSVEKRCLITFPAHRLFERWIAPYFIKLFISGGSHHERCIQANNSLLYRTMSEVFLYMTPKPIRTDDGAQDGNTFYVFKKG